MSKLLAEHLIETDGERFNCRSASSRDLIWCGVRRLADQDFGKVVGLR